MKQRQTERGGAGLWVVILLVVAGLLGGAGYWFYNRSGLAGSAFDLARYLPADTKVAIMVKLAGQLDPKALQKDIDDVMAKVPAEEREKFTENLQKDLGVPLADLIKFFDGRLAFGVLDSPKPKVIALIGLGDAKGFEAYLSSKAEKSHKTETIENVVFRVGPDNFYGHDSTWFYVADSKESAALAVKSGAQAQGLDKVLGFMEAKTKVSGQESLAAFYADIPALLKGLEGKNLPGTDAGTFKGLSSIGYAVASYNLKAKEAYGFLKVSQDDSVLAQKLLAKGGVTKASFAGVTKEVSSGQAIDAEWGFNTVVALMSLSPETRQQAAMAPMGLAIMGNPWTAFDGELAIGSDMLELMGPIFSSNFTLARRQGQTTACSSNLKNIGTALEMWSTDNSGKYPPDLKPLVPGHLEAVPTCPAAGSDTYSASYKTVGAGFSLACSGNHHGGENLPSYSSEEGLTPAPVMNEQPPAQPDPSAVVSAPVKDISLAHKLLLKAMPDAGAEPKVGEDKVYSVPGSELKMKTTAPANLVLAVGPRGAALADVSKGTLADHSDLKKVFDWGGDSLIHADYLDLTPLLEEIKKAVPKEEAAAPAILEAFDKLEAFGVRGASGIAVRADGLEYRSYGLGSGPLFGVGAAILVPNFVKARSQGQLTACKSNLKNIGTGLEMWATDNAGKYPKTLKELTPNYLKVIPSCPVAESDTYSSSYSLKTIEGFEGIYEVYCTGSHHSALGLPSDYPRYNGVIGLTERPE